MKFDVKRLAQLADWEIVAVAVALPWSTSATSILLVIWLLTVIPTLDGAAIWRELKTPVGGLPVMLWLLGAFGMLWADVSWAERFAGLGSFHRLLAIPLLLAQFRRSDNGWLALYAFLLSVIVLLAASWALVLGLMSWHTNWAPGVVVHDAIAQSTIFLICAFVLIWAVRDLLLEQNWWAAIGTSVLTALFLLNLIFVASSRADLLFAPALIILLGWQWLKWRGAILGCLAAALLAISALTSSPHLRARMQSAIDDINVYYAIGAHNDIGDHIEFMQKSIGFVREAPFIGHGTGSIPELFRKSIIGQTGAAAVFSVNPHNQILAIAIQLGLSGTVVLLGMWTAHYLLLHGTSLIAWIGTVVIVENVLSSTSSSHLFDFVHGWLYVLGVGIVGGMILGKTHLPSGAKDCADSCDRLA
jgi:O-antigen ligase